MPRRTTYDQVAVERAMTTAEDADLAALCRLHGIDRDRWIHVPALRQVYGGRAVWRWIDHRRRDRGCSQDRALTAAELRFGIPRSTICGWRYSWREHAA